MRGQRKSFEQVEVLRGIDLVVWPQQMVFINGPSGSGKSTLLRQILGLERPKSGSVIIKGTDITRCSQADLAKVRRSIGVAFQSAALFNSLTLEDNVALNLREHTALAPTTIDLIVWMKLAVVGLADDVDDLVGPARQADEGTAAHLWQLLMAGQLPAVAVFAIKWLPRSPRQALLVLALQLGAALAARAARGFGDGFAVIILPAYLSALGFDPIAIGIVATASLLGSALFTLAVGYLAPRFDLRNIMLGGALLMAATGIVFPAFKSLAFILAVAFIGTINPSLGDIGLLIPVEQSMLAREAADHERTRTFARYSLIGALANASGALAAAIPEFMVADGWSRIGAFAAMFYAYAALGVISAALYRRLPPARAEATPASLPLGASRGLVYRLAALYSLDSFA